MGKLVRDRIPEILEENGEKPFIKKLNANAFKKALSDKLMEEVAEFVVAANKKERIEELADIQEVMLAVYKAYGIECTDVTTYARKKRKKKGGFSKRIFLEKVQ